jgi:hypothetical protein
VLYVVTSIVWRVIEMVFRKLKLRTKHAIYFGVYPEDISQLDNDCYSGEWSVRPIVSCVMTEADMLKALCGYSQ